MSSASRSSRCAGAFLLSVALTTLVLSAACTPKRSTTLGEPVGVRLDGKDGGPTLEMALALPDDQPQAGASGVGGALAKAQRECPSLSALAPTVTLSLAFVVRDGVLVTPEPPPDAEAACVAKALAGVSVLRGAKGETEARVQLRVANKARR